MIRFPSEISFSPLAMFLALRGLFLRGLRSRCQNLREDFWLTDLITTVVHRTY